MNKKRWNAVLIYGFLFAFVLSFVFEGRVYYQVAKQMEYNSSYQNLVAMFFQMVGLLCSAVTVKTYKDARKVMGIMSVLCILITPCFLVPIQLIGYLVIAVVAFFSGMAIACWGAFYKYDVILEERLKAMADALIVANILMIFAGFISTFVSAMAGFIIALLYLVAALGILYCQKDSVLESEVQEPVAEASKNLKNSLKKALFVFAAFIIVITIDSGLMYGVVQTRFQELDALECWYWAIPYIMVLFIMRNLSKTKSSSVYIYIAIGMIMIGFLLFMFLGVSPVNYIFIDTMLLGAAGILDLFWSSIVGETLEYSKRPVSILGLGWAANVLGVLIGGVFSGQAIAREWSRSDVTVFALVVVCVTLMIVPNMLSLLRELLKSHMYLNTYVEASKEKKEEITRQATFAAELTGREREILDLVLQGKTNKSIAEELSISENTVKTHMRNILAKYEVANRTQLITKIMQQM